MQRDAAGLGGGSPARLPANAICLVCGEATLSAGEHAIVCQGCDHSYSVYCGVPVFTIGAPGESYVDSDDLIQLLETFGRYYNATTFAEARIRENGFHSVLSVGEGNGEYVLALALKLPEAEFVALDFDRNRVARAERLRRFLDVGNVHFVVADGARLPFRGGAFDFVYERGTFHILPDKAAHLRELARLAPRALLLTEMANGWWFLLNWRLIKLAFRAFGTSVDLTAQRETVRLLREIGGFGTWRFYERLFVRHGYAVEPIWHDFGVKHSYHRQFPRAVGAVSAAFGLDARFEHD